MIPAPPRCTSFPHKTLFRSLLQVAVPPSTGFAGTQLQNLGTISNTGFEVVLNATPMRRNPLTIETTLSLSTNHNKLDRKSTRLNSSHSQISYAVFCLKKRK